MSRKKIRNAVLTVVLWVVFWQVAAIRIDNPVFLPSPLDVLLSFKALLTSSEFFHSIAFSLGNIAKGFLLGVLFGSLLAITASASDFLCTFFSLPIRMIQATPVASFTILALLWMDSKQLSILISFFMVLPIIYTNVLTGIKETNAELLEMAKVFRVRSYFRARYFYAPAVIPYLFSACSVAVGLAWKSGIAAEVIGVAKNSIGNHLYQAKIYLEIPELFAWTAVTIFISILFEQLILRLLGIVYKALIGQSAAGEKELKEEIESEELPENSKAEHTEGLLGNEIEEYGKIFPDNGIFPDSSMKAGTDVKQSEEYLTENRILLFNITKAYGKQTVLKQVSLELLAGKPLALMGSSGIGKTTLLRIVLGTESQDSGSIERSRGARRFSVVFQENRLCEEISVQRNLELVCRTKGQKEKIPMLLKRLGLENCATKSASALSGGMKRRVTIGRALLADAPVLLLDEPFQGLDKATKLDVMHLVKEEIKGRLVLLVTHDKTEAEFFGCSIFKL